MRPDPLTSASHQPIAARLARQTALFYELGLIGLLLIATLGIYSLSQLGLADSLLMALIPYIGRHLFRLLQLTSYLRRHYRLAPPFPRGFWGEIYRAIGQYQQRNRKDRKRQLRFIRRFREASRAVPDALVVLDKNRHIEWANEAAEHLIDVQWPRDDGRRFSEIFQHIELEDYLREGDYSRPLDLTPAHNKSLMLSLRVAPFGERKKQRLVVARDITKLYHLNMIRRDFVANASHELRTPLTVIAGFIEHLEGLPERDPALDAPLGMMHKQTERMRSIIEDLLMLSRLEMDDQARQVKAIDIPAELELMVADARALAGEHHQFSIEADPDLLLLGNEAELRSALSNLLYNAVKHTGSGTSIRLQWRLEEGSPTFSVEDDGPGISPGHIPRLTERFYRVDAARSRASGGTGLGLAIVKHVLNRHDAELIIRSEIGVGSCFSCRFKPSTGMPRLAAEQAVAQSAKLAQAG